MGKCKGGLFSSNNNFKKPTVSDDSENGWCRCPGCRAGEAAQAEQHGGPPEGHPFVTVCRVSRCCWERAGVMRTRLM